MAQDWGKIVRLAAVEGDPCRGRNLNGGSMAPSYPERDASMGPSYDCNPYSILD
jgi:hypothetical protein